MLLLLQAMVHTILKVTRETIHKVGPLLPIPGKCHATSLHARHRTSHLLTLPQLLAPSTLPTSLCISLCAMHVCLAPCTRTSATPSPPCRR